MTHTVSFDALPELAGTDLGTTEWMDITQPRIDTFADATDDHQWIHCDPAKAADGPFGATIAHGYLTLSLVIPLFERILEVTGVRTKLNYGLNTVRFPAPVPVGSKVRLRARIVQVEPVGGGGVQLTWEAKVEVEGSEKPACVAQPVFRFYP